MSDASLIMTAYLNQTRSDLVKSYIDKGLKASGKFEKGLMVHVEDTGSVLKGYIESEGHAWFMEHGRAPNKEQTATQAKALGHILEQWVRDKGISVNPYAAAWKIVREGIRVPGTHNPGGVISEVITDDWFDGLIEKLSNWHIKVIQGKVGEMFKF
jgi:hypothetical protein